jgi:hypothetical protein
MKNIFPILITFILLSINDSIAQIEKGNWLIGGNGNINYRKTKDQFGATKDFNLSISPDIGYFLKNQLALGLRSGINNSAFKSNTTTSSNTSLGLGPFLRYYYIKPPKNINLASELSYSYFVNINRSISNNQGNSLYTFMTGPVLFLNKNVGLELLFGYKSNFKSGNSVNNSFWFSKLGFQFHFENNKRK